MEKELKRSVSCLEVQLEAVKYDARTPTEEHAGKSVAWKRSVKKSVFNEKSEDLLLMKS